MKNARGFTLIELVMVIVILGILAAVALPKFANLQGDARAASIQGAGGAVKSAMAIVHSQAIIEGKENNATDTVVLEGTTINLVYGYPSIASIDDAAGLIIGTRGAGGDYSIDDTNGVITLNESTTRSDCNVDYDPAASAGTPAVITAASATITTTGC